MRLVTILPFVNDLRVLVVGARVSQKRRRLMLRRQPAGSDGEGDRVPYGKSVRRTVLLLALVLGVVAGCAPAPRAPAGAQHPNIVLVLTDDLSMDLVSAMPHVVRMQADGTAFDRYFVTDSLCCPSRASIFTGRYPHSDGVVTNMGPHGGFPAFRRSAEHATFGTMLQSEGYRTAMIGKYLNGYQVGAVEGDARPPLPRGWNEWYVAGGRGYRQYDDDVDENGRIVHYGHAPAEYGTDVMAGQAVSFIRRAAAKKTAFLLEVAPFSPHKPATPAPRDAGLFPGAHAPRYPSFNRPNAAAPRWLRDRRPLRAPQIRRLDAEYRRRLQSVQAIDRLLARVQETLASTGTSRDTYVVFSSDNGYHMGEHQLIAGKQTAFDSDIHVPLVVTGPGVPAGRRVTELAENVDLAPTFAAIAGLPVPRAVEGRSLLPLLHGRPVTGWRDAVLVEHRGPNRLPLDPDRQGGLAGSPTSYVALRTAADTTYVAYADGEREYYDMRRDPYQRSNAVARLPAAQRAALERQLAALHACTDGPTCRAAGRQSAPVSATG